MQEMVTDEVESMGERTIPIKTALMPLYYKDFHCLAAACRDDCCHDWRITFDKKDYLKLKRAPVSPALGERMEKGVTRLKKESRGELYAQFQLKEDGRCPFHRTDGLCALQTECGAEVLPRVCQDFPRNRHYTPAAVEYSLTPACEGVLELLWGLPEGIDFWEEPLAPKDQGCFTNAKTIHTWYAAIRSLCIDILQERALSLPKRFLLLGFLLQQLQKLDWESDEALDGWLSQGEAALHDQSLAGVLEQLPGDTPMFLSHNHGVATRILVGNQRERRQLAYQLCESIKTVVPGKERRTILDVGRYRELERHLLEKFPELDGYFWENLMVSEMFRTRFPFIGSPEDMWKSYVNLCSLYSFFRFSAVCGSAEADSKERLFRVLVNMSRAILHNHTRQSELREELFRNDSATLAHMAILVSG